MGSGFGDAERVVTRWMRFRCKDDNLPGEMKRPHAAPYMFRPAGLLLVVHVLIAPQAFFPNCRRNYRTENVVLI